MYLVDSEIRILNMEIHFFDQRCSRCHHRVDSVFFFFLFGLRNLRADRGKERPSPESLTLSLRWYEALCCLETK